MTLVAEGLSISHLIDNSDFFSRVRDAITGQTLKVFIDTQGISTTYDRNESRQVPLDAEPMSHFRVEKIKSAIAELDRLLQIDFAYTDNKEDSNIALMQYPSKHWQYPSNSGLASCNLKAAFYDQASRKWSYKYECDIHLPSDNDSLITQGSNHWQKTILHELGHALGLEHPFDSDDGDIFGDKTYPTADHTLMAYGAPQQWGKYPTWYQPIDVQALVTLWGQEPGYVPSTTTNANDSSSSTSNASSTPTNLNGGIGSNRLTGTEGADRFTITTFDTNPDTIISFNSEAGDKLVLSGDAFGGWIGAKKDLYLGVAYTARQQRRLYNSKYADIIYNASNGQLFYNKNEGNWGLGSGGGLFAVLEGAPTITRDCFEVV